MSEICLKIFKCVLMKCEYVIFYAPRRENIQLPNLPLVCPSIHPSVRPSHFCSEHISKSIKDNLMKLDTLIEGHEENSTMQEP